MSDSKPRLATLAQEFDIGLSPATIDNLSSLHPRLEQRLAWPEWEGDRSPSVVPEISDTLSDGVAKYTRDIEDALSRASLVADGGAYTFIDEYGARRAGQKGRPGPLAGTPIAVKDLIAVIGRPVGACSAVRQDVPNSLGDAPVVAELRRAGAIIMGTTALHEFAFGVTGINGYTGTPRNPHDPSRVPGGSSSGSAVAVAEGSAQIAIGTDTGGSVRIPAALCGIVGFKPAFGTYPIEGVFPLSPTLDHVGFMARSVTDIGRAHSLFAPYEHASNNEGVKRPARVGVIPAELAQCDQTVQTTFEKCLRLLRDSGCELVDISSLWPESEDVFVVSTAIMYPEAAAIHEEMLRRHADLYGEDVRDRLIQGLAIPGTDYVMARQMREQLRDQVRSILAGVDCLIGPTVGIVAPKFEDALAPEIAGQLVAFTRLANVVGLPAISIPAPGDGLPVGLQILSNENERTLQVAAFIEGLIAAG